MKSPFLLRNFQIGYLAYHQIQIHKKARQCEWGWAEIINNQKKKRPPEIKTCVFSEPDWKQPYLTMILEMKAEHFSQYDRNYKKISDITDLKRN